MTLHNQAKGYLLELHRVACPEESRSSFFFAFFSNELPFPEASLLFLQVIQTHFVLSSYNRSLRIPITFFTGLARLEVEPRLSRSSWRDFASIHPLRLFLLLLERFSLLAHFPSCNPSAFSIELTLCFHSFRSDFFSLAKVQLSLILTLSHLMI